MLIRFAELEHYTSLPVQPIQAGLCDVVVKRPTIFMKLDAGMLNTFYPEYGYFIVTTVTLYIELLQVMSI